MTYLPPILMAIGALDPAEEDGLSSKAKRKAQRLGTWIAQQGTRPARVLAENTPAALTSAEKAMKAAGWTADGITPVGTCADVTLSHGDFLVASAQALSAVPGGAGMRPGSLRVLGETARDIRPRDLPKGFPYPAPDGAERRKRPAYYYSQSGVIAWRAASGGGVEVLLITSSSGRRWTIPKGIIEPGLTAAASAAKEAEEEAGLTGDLSPAPIGRYAHHKWGAECDVQLFAMRARQRLPRWEIYRHQEWLPPAEAAARIEVEGLRALIAGFTPPD